MLVTLALVLSLAAPPQVRATTLPHAAVVGAQWQAVLRATARPTLVAVGPTTLRVRAGGRRGVFRVTVRFPSAGSWRVSAVVGRRTVPLGTVAVDVPRDPLLADPFTIAVDEAGAILVGQRDTAPLVRIAGARASELAHGRDVFHVTTAASGIYVAAGDGAVYRVEGAAFVRVTPALEADSVAVDAAGNVYVAIYDGLVKRVAPSGAVSTLASDLAHPHSLALGPDNALYIADTENRRIRRIDLSTGKGSTFGGDVGITVSVAVAPDGTVYSADVPRDGVGGGITATTAGGVTRRILANADSNGVAVAPDGTVYVNLWQRKRIQRLDVRSGRLEPVARG